MIRRYVRAIDERVGGASWARKALNHVFPDHWSFMLGEVALYSFVVLVLTGVYLSFFFEASTKEVVYHGSYAPLQGRTMSAAYDSTLYLSFDVRGTDPQSLRKNAFAVIDSAQVMSIATNLGATKTIVSHSATTSILS